MVGNVSGYFQRPERHTRANANHKSTEGKRNRLKRAVRRKPPGPNQSSFEHIHIVLHNRHLHAIAARDTVDAQNRSRERAVNPS
jgi:hypothetical protein